jgi:hypothetical protein
VLFRVTKTDSGQATTSSELTRDMNSIETQNDRSSQQRHLEDEC